MVFTNSKSNGVNKSDVKMKHQNDNNLLNKEDEVVDLLFDGLSNLERGIRGLDKNIVTSVGKIDILAIDMVGRAVIIEVGKSNLDDLLFKSIDHFDWALTNMKDIEGKYKLFNIDPTLAPRIIILASSYSDKFIKRASYLNPTFIDIYEYQIKEGPGVRKIYFRPFSFINHRKWIIDLKMKSLDDHLNYIEDDNLREALKSFLIEIQSVRNDLTIDTSRSYIRFKDKSDKSIIGIYVLKNSFWINLVSAKWNGNIIKTKENLYSLKPYILGTIRRES